MLVMLIIMVPLFLKLNARNFGKKNKTVQSLIL